jgi:hypothetical protein
MIKAACKVLLPFLHQHVELSTPCSSTARHNRYGSPRERHGHLIQMPYTARLAPRCFGAPGVERIKYVNVAKSDKSDIEPYAISNELHLRLAVDGDRGNRRCIVGP